MGRIDGRSMPGEGLLVRTVPFEALPALVFRRLFPSVFKKSSPTETYLFSQDRTDISFLAPINQRYPMSVLQFPACICFTILRHTTLGPRFGLICEFFGRVAAVSLSLAATMTKSWTQDKPCLCQIKHC